MAEKVVEVNLRVVSYSTPIVVMEWRLVRFCIWKCCLCHQEWPQRSHSCTLCRTRLSTVMTPLILLPKILSTRSEYHVSITSDENGIQLTIFAAMMASWTFPERYSSADPCSSTGISFPRTEMQNKATAILLFESNMMKTTAEALGRRDCENVSANAAVLFLI